MSASFVMALQICNSRTNLGALIRLTDFSHFYKGDNFCEFLFAFFFFASVSFWKEVYSKKKEFALIGSKVFRFRNVPISVRDKINSERIASPINIFIPLKVTSEPVLFRYIRLDIHTGRNH